MLARHPFATELLHRYLTSDDFLTTDRPMPESAHPFLDPPEADGEIGRLGPYRVLGVLGKGGMGEVFQAEDSRLKRSVALKVMKGNAAATSNARQRFVDEARSMAAVHHDNVATIFEVGLHRKMPFLAMEMLRGEPLDKRMKGRRRFDPETVLRIAKEVALGLEAAHAKGIVHRDIKPANIWLEEPSDRAKILDFGLAIAGEDQLSPRNSVIGSPGYLSPEQARNEPIDDRTDLYGLGVVLYQMCTGRLPLASSSLSGQLIKIICHPIPSMEAMVAKTDQPEIDIPKPLADLIYRLLSKEPKDRPSSAKHLSELVDRVAEQCRSQSHAALQIVTEPTKEKSHRDKAQAGNQSPADGDETSSTKGSTKWLWIATAVSALLLLVGIGAWLAIPARVASEPVAKPTPINTARKKPKPINIIAMRSMKLLPIKAATSEVIAGEAARFKIPIANEATDASVDPKTVYSDRGYVGKLTTRVKLKSGGSFTSPTFPKRFAAKQLPDRGQSREVEIQFLTKTLPAGNYDVQFEFRTPENQKCSEVSGELLVKENLAESDLLGFTIVRTHAGQGGDTYLHNDWDTTLESNKEIEVLRQGKGDYTKEQHAYLRFDLRRSKMKPSKVDRAILLLTVAGGSVAKESLVNVYGVREAAAAKWDSGDPDSFRWKNSPSEAGITNQVYLGQLTVQNENEALKDQTDQVRFYSEALDDFLRSAEGTTVTLALVSETWSDQPTRFRSKDGKPDQAPALAIRRVP